MNEKTVEEDAVLYELMGLRLLSLLVSLIAEIPVLQLLFYVHVALIMQKLMNELLLQFKDWNNFGAPLLQHPCQKWKGYGIKGNCFP